MNKMVIVVHGGAGGAEEYIEQNKEGYKKGLQDALDAGWEILKKKGKAVDAVEAAINSLENNPLFNAGRGSAINAKGEVEMCASIMDGSNRNSGAVAVVKNVKNPISLAKAIMDNTKFIYLAGEGALDYAKRINIELEPESYFVTEHQYDEYLKKRKDAYVSNREVAMEQINQRMHGTVGAVALDMEGNLAAGTSTGGTPYNKEGRIGDSSMVGVGSFADNATCAVSSTGDGEYLIRGVICHSVASIMKYKEKSLREAAREVVQIENKGVEGDIGLIAVDRKGNIAMELNCERMHRGWKTADDKSEVKIYKED